MLPGEDRSLPDEPVPFAMPAVVIANLRLTTASNVFMMNRLLNDLI